MNVLLTFGLLLILAHISGLLLQNTGLPKIIGYIATGVLLSPNSFDIIDASFTQATQPIMEICLAFIAFEVGGELKWEKIQSYKKDIISIALMESFAAYILTVTGIFSLNALFPQLISLDPLHFTVFAFLLGALACPTAPAATLAVMHQYKAKGKVTNTILGVVALDDVLGILLFSITLSLIPIFVGGLEGLPANHHITDAVYKILVAILIGILLGYTIRFIAKFMKPSSEGIWVIIIFSLIIFCVGISEFLQIDKLLAYMTMGVVIVNTCDQHKIIFGILNRYTEELIFLIFFVLSGLHMDIMVFPQVAPIIVVFVIFRSIGKFAGVYTGASITGADKEIRKYTFGGLIPQAGIVIGLVLSIYQREGFMEIADILLTTIMGATIINELIGPVLTKYTLMKAKEIKSGKH
ncbi:MAG: cation:proton antiporter [Bacteroidales bacterium]